MKRFSCRLNKIMENQNLFERINQWARKSVTLKLFSIGFLILLLLIPGSMLNSLIHEREQTRSAAIHEVSASWGASQIIAGPVISFPWQRMVKNDKGQMEWTTGYAHFLPENLEITGHLKPIKKYRGIYVVVLYSAELEIKGYFDKINPDAAGISGTNYDLSKAVISLGISDNKGIREAVFLDSQNKKGVFKPGLISNDIFSSGISTPLDTSAERTYFNIRLNINGSSEIYFLPFGKSNTVILSGSWGNPSFQGDFLPVQKSISDSSFTATWKILELNRKYPQAGTGKFTDGSSTVEAWKMSEPQLPESAFGVKLLLPVDEYQKTMRVSKYGIMFVIITFIAFFFIEVLSQRRVHPIQYFLIGCAVILFYVLLLSISEHLSFNTAYLISSTAILLLISLYSKAILKNTKHALLIGSMLAVLYAFFYSLLQLQDYALLLGSIGLLAVLSLIMYLTRNINWYGLNEKD